MAGSSTVLKLCSDCPKSCSQIQSFIPNDVTSFQLGQYMCGLMLQNASQFYSAVKSINVTDSSSSSHGNQKPTSLQVWGIGLGFVTLINLGAFLGALFWPIQKFIAFKLLMIFMVALAVGSLAGSALLVLIPEALEIEKEGSASKLFLWKSTTVLAGIYGFFLLERLLKVLIGRQCGKNETKNLSPSVNPFPVVEISENSVVDISVMDPARSTGGNNYLPDKKKKSIAPVGWMIILGDGIHNFVDGLTLGAAFSKSIFTGISLSIAVICEEYPHELGDFAVLLNSGMSIKKALLGNFFSACTCYLGFVIGVFMTHWADNSSWILAVAGGMFLYISLVDMMPEVIRMYEMDEAAELGRGIVFLLQNLGLIIGYCCIFFITFYGDNLKFD